MAHSAPHSLCFPESFSRTFPLQEPNLQSEELTTLVETESYFFPTHPAMPSTEIDRNSLPSPSVRSSRSSVMKLENILNDVSIGDPPYHSRSLCVSPVRSEAQSETDVSSFLPFGLLDVSLSVSVS